MTSLVYSLIAVFLVSLVSLLGLLFVSFKFKILRELLFVLVSFAAGSLLADAFLHLLPEAIEEQGFNLNVSLAVLLGILLFFVLEKFIFWRHCHIPTCKTHPHTLGWMNLVGDGFHNFIDGMIIAASFLASLPLGLTTALAVLLHEVPQEIGDFGVLIYSGFSRRKALVFNFVSALTAFLGAFLVFALGRPWLTNLIVPFTAGGFLYLAGSDLIPELQKETGVKKSLVQLLGLLAGMGLMLLVRS